MLLAVAGMRFKMYRPRQPTLTELLKLDPENAAAKKVMAFTQKHLAEGGSR